MPKWYIALIQFWALNMAVWWLMGILPLLWYIAKGDPFIPLRIGIGIMLFGPAVGLPFAIYQWGRAEDE